MNVIANRINHLSLSTQNSCLCWPHAAPAHPPTWGAEATGNAEVEVLLAFIPAIWCKPIPSQGQRPRTQKLNRTSLYIKYTPEKQVCTLSRTKQRALDCRLFCLLPAQRVCIDLECQAFCEQDLTFVHQQDFPSWTLSSVPPLIRIIQCWFIKSDSDNRDYQIAAGQWII